MNALDFNSPKALADHLIYLTKNKAAYNSYFKWKRHVLFDQQPLIYNPSICDMCIQLHLEDYYGIKKRTIDNLNAFWNENQKKCIT